MLIKVIGAGAGGGLPQWNCNGQNSADARHGLPTVKPRTQASIAVSADGKTFYVNEVADEATTGMKLAPTRLRVIDLTDTR